MRLSSVSLLGDVMATLGQTYDPCAARPLVAPSELVPQKWTCSVAMRHVDRPSDRAGFVPPPPAPHAVARPERGTAHVISLGSVGHPFKCAEACKYVKRKGATLLQGRGGCRDGANCTKCHECFWSRVPAGADVEQKIPEPAQVEAQPFSIGSAGHPYTCSNPCKYVWRKQGCRDGADCPNCHYCKWQRKPQEEVQPTVVPAAAVTQNLEAMAIPPPPGLTPMEPETQQKLSLRKILQGCSTVGATSRKLDAVFQKKNSEDSEPLILQDFPEMKAGQLVFLIESACRKRLLCPSQPRSVDLLSSLGSLGHPYSRCKDGTLCPNCHLCRWSRYANLKVFHL
eukprot:Skav232060  [mRNA]  locus=scaffold1641:117783:126482:- [translate_table: standard]